MSEEIKPLPHPSPDPHDELLAGGTWPGERPEDRTVPPDDEELDRRRRIEELTRGKDEKFRPDRDEMDPVAEASEESFPASDPPSWTPTRP